LRTPWRRPKVRRDSEQYTPRVQTRQCGRVRTHIACLSAPAHNLRVRSNPWQQRAERAEQLASQIPAAAEVLRFFVRIVRFQEELYRWLATAPFAAAPLSFQEAPDPSLTRQFRTLLAVAEGHGPDVIAKTARELQEEDDDSHSLLLQTLWMGGDEAGPETSARHFLARAFLQPYAEFIRSKIEISTLPHTPCLCPVCNHKPGMGVLRPLGDGGQRFLLCSLCLHEWEFRRIVCPGCGEADHAKLPVYRAEEFSYMRVECCDVCKTYIKTADLTENGLAVPVVDEMAAISLDLWAQRQGYSKLQVNLMQF
jgi:FdhE protein